MFGDQNNSLGFPIKTVEELANVKVGLVIKPTRFYNDIHRDVKALRGVNIKNGKIKDDNWVFFSNESNKINFRTQVHKGDVVVVRTGDPGQSAVVTDQFNNCNAIDLLIATPDTSRILPSYLSSFTNFSHGREQIKMSVGGAAQKHFNVSKYESMKVFLPSMDLQRSYELFLKSVDKSSVIGTLQYINTIRKDIDLKYLFYVLKHLDLAKYKSGATIPHIYFKDYSNQTFYLPSMEDQKEIVRIFDVIEKTKEKMNEMLKDLDLMVKSREVRELYYNEQRKHKS